MKLNIIIKVIKKNKSLKKKYKKLNITYYTSLRVLTCIQIYWYIQESWMDL